MVDGREQHVPLSSEYAQRTGRRCKTLLTLKPETLDFPGQDKGGVKVNIAIIENQPQKER